MSSWFHKPKGYRRRKGDASDPRPPVEVKIIADKKVIKFTVKANYNHAETKAALLKAVHMPKVDADSVTLLDEAGERVPCVYDAFVEHDQECARSRAAGIPGTTDALTFIADPTPNCRALERADVVRHWNEDESGPCPIKFQPPDNIFRLGKGLDVDDTKTETKFVGATLCDVWKIDSYIQSGSFGRGWVGVDMEASTPTKVFIKTFRSFSDRPRRRKADGQKSAEIQKKQELAIRKEIEVLLHPKFHRATNHPGVVSNMLCYGNVKVPQTGMEGEMFFIMTPDLCEGGELFNYLCPPTPPYVRSFSVGTARRLFRMIANGVAHMHGVGCYHRDLKLENLVVTGDFTVKIMDFGSAKFEDQLKTVMDEDGGEHHITSTYAGVGTSGYKPAEARLGHKSSLSDVGGYDPMKFDVWSCGVILFFMVAGDVVFNKLGGQLCFRFIELIATKKKFPDFMSEPGEDIDEISEAPRHTKMWQYLEAAKGEAFDEDLKVCINLMLDVDAQHRADMNTVCDCDFLRGKDIDNSEFFAEMRSRPIQAGGDLVGDKALKMSRIVPSRAPDIKAGRALVVKAVKAIPASADGGRHDITVHGDEIDIGLDANGEVLWRIAFLGNDINVYWINGSLTQWLEFSISLKINLGLDAE
eukprot:m.176015 g.176015  ORF g.176015 m.176015 type:complete len:642 (+) comp14093_c0_seq1:73-1998(+)